MSAGTYERTCRASKTSGWLALSGALPGCNRHHVFTYPGRSCLDDEELELLGVPWAEYSSTADELGLDVLRSVQSYTKMTMASLDFASGSPLRRG